MGAVGCQVCFKSRRPVCPFNNCMSDQGVLRYFGSNTLTVKKEKYREIPGTLHQLDYFKNRLHICRERQSCFGDFLKLFPG